MSEPKINDGGAAFPRPIAFNPNNGEIAFEQDGMSLRDYFAAKAMQALFNNHFDRDAHYITCAEVSYRMADAMIKARRVAHAD